MQAIELQQDKQLKLLQGQIKKIRTIFNWSGNELSQILGVSRQTINNLETGKSPLTPVQYLAIAATIEKMQREHPNLRQILNPYLNNRRMTGHNNFCNYKENLLEKWFDFFPELFNKAALDMAGVSSMDLMESLARDYKIFLSPNFLFDETYRDAIENLGEICLAHSNSIVIPATALKKEKCKITHDTSKIVSWYNELKSKGIFQLFGQDDDSDFYEMILSLFLQYRNKYNLCIITNEDLLAKDILSINGMQSISGRPVTAVSISKKGFLYKYEDICHMEDKDETFLTLNKNFGLCDEFSTNINNFTLDSKTETFDNINVDTSEILEEGNILVSTENTLPPSSEAVYLRENKTTFVDDTSQLQGWKTL